VVPSEMITFSQYLSFSSVESMILEGLQQQTDEQDDYKNDSGDVE
jgi:hypothetical protein